jgi:DNA-binding phage protein
MALTRDFKETIKARAERDPAFRQALAQEAIDCFLNNDVETGKALVRDYINATIGFEALAEEIKTPTKSLMRMFGPKGNPQARSLFPVIAHIRRRERLAA